jgi:hypothetical protein
MGNRFSRTSFIEAEKRAIFQAAGEFRSASTLQDKAILSKVS